MSFHSVPYHPTHTETQELPGRRKPGARYRLRSPRHKPTKKSGQSASNCLTHLATSCKLTAILTPAPRTAFVASGEYPADRRESRQMQALRGMSRQPWNHTTRTLSERRGQNLLPRPSRFSTSTPFFRSNVQSEPRGTNARTGSHVARDTD